MDFNDYIALLNAFLAGLFFGDDSKEGRFFFVANTICVLLHIFLSYIGMR